jgi:hypothetical protein
MDVRRIVAAAVFSGAPSTVWALAARQDVLESTRAAGTLLGKATVVRGALAHTAISAFWGAVIQRTTRTRLQGAAAGLAIAALDLGVIGRRYPAVRALPALPQVADHVAFGVIASGASARRG